MWCLPARATVQCPRPPSTPPWTSNSNGCFCDETPENTGCTASCIPDGSTTAMTCGEYSNRVCSVSLPHSPARPLLTGSLPPEDFLELWYRWEGVEDDDWNFWELNSDPDACDVFDSDQIVTVEEFTAGESPDCDCTGCLCDGTMDETTSDWRACPATCGSAAENVMMSCDQFNDMYSAGIYGLCTMSFTSGGWSTVDDYWGPLCDCTGCACDLSYGGCWEQYVPDATTTANGQACTTSGTAGYEYYGYTCTDDEWCVIDEAVGACTTDCGGCASYYPNRCANFATGRCEECPEAPPTLNPTLPPTSSAPTTPVPTLNPTGTCPNDCSNENCDYWFEKSQYTCEFLESTLGCSCDGCNCGEAGDPTTTPTVLLAVEPSRLPTTQPTLLPTLTMQPTTPGPTSGPTQYPVPVPTSSPTHVPTRFADRADYDDYLLRSVINDDGTAAQEGQL
mmetsp:Transcript_102513/g.293500  ORF Transcript_102513/g.293500 Transcript_102513/m.293500 type:complete len:450 (+) Transcript_102513:176-1525(+)